MNQTTRRLGARAGIAAAGALCYLLLGNPPLLPAAQSDSGEMPVPQKGGSQVQILPQQRLPTAPAQRAPRNQLQIPSLRQTPQRPGTGRFGSQSAHTIPQAFFGCWRGVSMPPDSAQYLGGCPPGRDVPEIQKLCFKRLADGAYEIAFQSATAALPNFQDHTDLISSEGEFLVNLSDAGSYDLSGWPVVPLHITFSGTSRCELSADKEFLRCRSTTQLNCGGLPWYRTTGRTELWRVPP